MNKTPHRRIILGALLGLSACLHFAVLMDYAATKSGTPFLLGFSKKKFALIAMYACFILSHLNLMFASHHYRSPTGDPSLWVKWESIAERALQEMEIPYVNLSKRFAELGYSKDTLNYKFGGHWRAEGHLRGAEEIALSLRKMHVPQDW